MGRKYYSEKSLSSTLFLKGLLPKQGKQQGQENTDKDGGNNWEVEGEILPSDDNISGKPADPRNLLPDHQKNPDENNKNTE